MKMKKFFLKKYSSVPRDELFQISTDIENFASVMPNYFKSLSVVEDSSKEKIVDEQISFLGITTNVKSKHAVVPPNMHEVHILTGHLRGTSFIERYEKSGEGTEVQIDVSLCLNGLIRFIPIMEDIIARRMKSIFNEFIRCSEIFSKKTT